MLKFFKENLFNIITSALIPFLLWVFKEYIPDSWDSYIIPLKINIFLISIFLFFIGFLLFIIFKQYNKIKHLDGEINKVTKLSPLDHYDLLYDDQNIVYCSIHKKPVTQTGPWGYSEGSYWCADCEMWYEKKTKDSNNSISSLFDNSF